jgi:hypothetical protein
VDAKESSAPHAHTSSEDHDTLEAHYASLERAHTCYEGVVYIGHLVEDPGTGEEVEVLERVMNLGKSRIEMRISRSAWSPRDLRFPHS